MERQLPKNVRQIGNVSDTPKIYVEDYVDTFFTQLCDRAQQEPVGAFLVGEIQKTEEEEYVFIYGAIQMHELRVTGQEYRIDEDTWKNGYEDCKQYFEDGEILGWFVASPGNSLELEGNMLKVHRKAFPKAHTILILKDSIEKEEAYYVHKFHDLLQIGGHFTYYEKNPSMQNYMISTRKRNGVCPSETIEDRAAKDFRSLVRSKEEIQLQKRTLRMMYMVSMLLVVMVLVMGIATINNFHKMKGVFEKEVPEDVIQEDEVQEVFAPIQVVEETAAEAEVNGSDGVYVVEEGDTLAIISMKMYGDLSHVDALCKMNGLSDGDFIYIGQKLVLP